MACLRRRPRDLRRRAVPDVRDDHGRAPRRPRGRGHARQRGSMRFRRAASSSAGWVRPADVRTGQQVIFEERRGTRALPPQLHRVVDVESVNGNVIARTGTTTLRENRSCSRPRSSSPSSRSASSATSSRSCSRLSAGSSASRSRPVVLAFICLWHVWRPEEELDARGLPAPLYAPPAHELAQPSLQRRAALGAIVVTGVGRGATRLRSACSPVRPRLGERVQLRHTLPADEPGRHRWLSDRAELDGDTQDVRERAPPASWHSLRRARTRTSRPGDRRDETIRSSVRRQYAWV